LTDLLDVDVEHRPRVKEEGIGTSTTRVTPTSQIGDVGVYSEPMGLFKRRARTAPEMAESTPAAQVPEPTTDTETTPAAQPVNAAESAVETVDETPADRAGELQQELAEERQEYDDEVESGRISRRGLNPHWGLYRDDSELAKREARAVADPESDNAETRFIQSEKEAEQRGRYGLDR